LDELIRGAAASSDRKWFLLSSWGFSETAAIEREKVFDTLMLYVHDPTGPRAPSAINGWDFSARRTPSRHFSIYFTTTRPMTCARARRLQSG
jgi:hypothetical protein